MREDKRKRSPNWLPSEKEHLLSLVEAHYKVLENKKIDGVTMKTKLREWKIIADEYNNQTAHSTRSAENLRAQWESMKKVARKEAVNSKKSISQTVDGLPKLPKKDEQLQHRILSLLSNSSGAGLFNPYDSDSSVPALQDQSNPDIQTDEYTPITDPEIFIKTERMSDEECDVPDPVTKVNEQYMPQESQDLKVDNAEKKHTPIPTPSHRTWLSRRRQPSSSEQLYKKNIEAIDLQNKLALEEAERLKVRHDLDVQIKKEILRQEKVKSNLLFIRRRKLLGLRRKENHLLSVHNQNGNEA